MLTFPAVEREAVAPGLLSLVRQISTKILALGSRLLGLSSSASREKKMTAKPIVLQDLPLI